MSLSIVVATDEQGGIGKDMEIPWYIREDMRRFKEITTKKQTDVNSKVIEYIYICVKIFRLLDTRHK